MYSGLGRWRVLVRVSPQSCFYLFNFTVIFLLFFLRTTILSVSLVLERWKSLVLERRESLELERRSLVRTTEIFSVSLVLERRESLVLKRCS